MSAGRILHRVYARVSGRVALVNSFPDVEAAAQLTAHLAERYAAQDATFWHSTEPTHAPATWRRMRDQMRAAKQPAAWIDALDRRHNTRPISRAEARRRGVSRHREVSARAAPVAAVTAEEIDGFLAAGGAISILPAHGAKRRRARR